MQFGVTPYACSGLGIYLQALFPAISFSGPEDADRYLALMLDYARLIESMREKVSLQAQRGWRVPRPALPGAVATLQGLKIAAAATFPVSSSRLVALADAKRTYFADAVARMWRTEVEPAFDSLIASLGPEYQRAAPQAVGLSQFPGGEEAYRTLAREHVTFDIDPERIHVVGVANVARLSEQMRAIRSSLGFDVSEASFNEHLRTSGRLHARSARDVENRYRYHIARVSAVVSRYFGKQPSAGYDGIDSEDFGARELARNGIDRALLSDRDDSIDAGVDMSFSGRYGELKFQALADVLDASGGYEVSYGYPLSFGERLIVTPNIGARWQCADRADYYYGILDEEVARAMTCQPPPEKSQVHVANFHAPTLFIRMKVIVIGGGLAGVTSAWLLRARGHELTVLEREQGPGQQASFANGGMLTPGMCEPWNAPGVWRVLLGSVGRSDAALQLRLRALPSLVRWGMMFLRNSTAVAFERNHRSNVQLAMYSLAVMRTIGEHVQIDYGCAARGSLGLFRDRAALDRAANEANRLSAAGLQSRRLTTAESVDIEPALAPIADRLSGALLYESDEVGDAHQYCVSLAERARAAGVQFRFGVEASLEMRNGRLTGVIADGERLVADRYVVAAGSYSTLLLRRAGVRLPVRPVKGYSITFDSDGQPELQRPIIDHHLHAVIVPFQGAVRVAGTAEFAGYDRSLNAARVRNLLAMMRDVLPQGRWTDAAAKPWCGLRPSSPDGVAIIGPTPLDNLWINSGQGHLGWTLAAGSAQLLTDLLSGDRPALDPAPYSLARF